MALFRIAINSISRAARRSAPAAAAYRAGERIRDERTGILHNYTRRRDVNHAEILLPARWSDSELRWARDRSQLWNAAEAAERRRNSRVAREFQVTLPVELTPVQRVQLARAFAGELADRYSVAVDLAVHAPRADGDPRNHHAHLLTTTRELTATGLGAKTGLDMSYVERLKRGLGPGLQELVAIRRQWATLVNEAFRSAGIEARVDHRSLRAQGIDREPMPHIPYVAYRMERRGVRSEVAERIRERYRERVAAREALNRAGDAAGIAAAAVTSGVTDIEELRRRSRVAWLALRGETQREADPQRMTTLSHSATPDASATENAPREPSSTELDQEFGL
jgi:ATP-dependent exoDNAse (exonuclease V) alpha subunit